jgi:hypothetical protein
LFSWPALNHGVGLILVAAEGGVMMEGHDEPMVKWFSYMHLPEDLREVSYQFYKLALDLCSLVEAGPERTVSLRKLLEAKDAAVRAVVHPGG